MYSLSDYGNMIGDRDRFSAYSRAIATSVRSGDTVAEIGSGPGVLALLACQAGAKKVYAIETEDIIEISREIAEANGLTDRIDFIQADSRRIELPQRVHVIVSDTRGALPLFGQAIPTLEHARQHFLLPKGILIPQRDVLKAAVVQTDYYSRITSPWTNSVPSLNLSSVLPMLFNSEFYHRHFSPEQLLTAPLTWYVLDYTASATTWASGEMQFQATQNGIAHGVCVWFEAQLFGDIGYSTGPGTSERGISGQLFLPWPEPVRISLGQDICVGLHANLVGQDYIWRWEAKLRANGTGSGHHFRQSTLQGVNFTPHSLRRRAADFVPSLSEEGQADRWLLHAMDGKTCLQEMANSAAERFPAVFPRWEDALNRAAELARQFSR